MMINGAPIHGFSNHQDLISSSSLDHATSSSQETNPTSFLYNLSLLKDKILQIESVSTVFLSPESTAIAVPTMTTLIQELIVTASSMMFACQQMSLSPPPATNSAAPETGDSVLFHNHHDSVDQWVYGDGDNRNLSQDRGDRNCTEGVCRNAPQKSETENNCTEGVCGNAAEKFETENYDIIELEAADLLAKYTHYCHVCGKGFKRDANLRMHMRAHGDEYKTSAALSNPLKNSGWSRTGSGERRKYSCPQEGCRWNVKHAKFQPLKSMICVKNHYKRSHCPKMYVCKRCNRKQFSVLSDLRTHEKHCGDLKWLCSCGTTFSRKDKLMGHVALFVGHMPASSSLSTKIGNGR